MLSVQPSFEQPSESSAESSSVGRELVTDVLEAVVAVATGVGPPTIARTPFAPTLTTSALEVLVVWIRFLSRVLCSCCCCCC